MNHIRLQKELFNQVIQQQSTIVIKTYLYFCYKYQINEEPKTIDVLNICSKNKNLLMNNKDLINSIAGSSKVYNERLLSYNANKSIYRFLKHNKVNDNHKYDYKYINGNTINTIQLDSKSYKETFEKNKKSFTELLSYIKLDYSTYEYVMNKKGLSIYDIKNLIYINKLKNVSFGDKRTIQINDYINDLGLHVKTKKRVIDSLIKLSKEFNFNTQYNKKSIQFDFSKYEVINNINVINYEKLLKKVN